MIAETVVAQATTSDLIAPAVVILTVVAPVVLGDKTATFIHYFSWPVVTMLVVLIVAGFLLWNAQKSTLRFDMKDLILDHDSNRVSLSKFSNLVALCVSSWAMVALVVGGVMTEAYLAAFMLSWSGNALGQQYLKTRAKADDSKLES